MEHPTEARVPSRWLTIRSAGGVAAAGAVFLVGVLFQGLGRPGSLERKSPAQAQYELGRQYWNGRGGEMQTEGAKQAFRTAIRLDPKFALAHVGLADCYLFEADGIAAAEGEIHTALALDPQAGEAYASLGFLRMFHHQDWKGAEEAFQKSLRLRPNYATGHQWRGTLLLVRSRFDEARAQYRRASSLDLLPIDAVGVASLEVGGSAGSTVNSRGLVWRL